MNYNGHATALGALGPTGANLAASADFHFPETLAFGYSFRPTAKWNVEADVNWSDWSELKSVPLISSPPLPSIDTLNFNWRPSWMVDLGVTRYVGNDWRISGGWMYSMNSVPDANFNPLVPDSDRFLFSLGVGKKCGPFSWDVAYQFGWGPSRTVAGDTSPSIAPGLPDGNYEFFNDALSLNIGYHF
jgi:long-chain fatty acid transport protein